MVAKYIGITMEGIEDIAAEEVQGKKKEKENAPAGLRMTWHWHMMGTKPAPSVN